MPRRIKIPDPGNWLRLVSNHPWQVLAIVLIITVFFVFQLPDLRVQTSIYDLTIEDLQASEQYHSFKKQFGSEEIILVVARTDNVFRPETFEKVKKLSEKFSAIKGVKRIISLPHIMSAMDVTEKWTLADFEKIISPIELFKKNLISNDKKTTAISLVLEDVNDKDRIVESVETILKNERRTTSLYQIGMPVVSHSLARFTENDFLTLPPVTFLLIVLLLFSFFRNIRGVAIPAGSVLMALIWTLGIMALTGTPLSMLTMIVPIFLIAVGTAYCMYIIPEYMAAIKNSENPREASLRCFSELFLPTSLAVITTSIGLGSLLVNKIVAIREFAIFSCIGILCTLVIIFTFLPALTSLLPFPSKNKSSKRRGGNLLKGVLSLLIRIDISYQKIVLPVIAVVMIVGLMGITRIHIETNPVSFFKEDTAVSKNFHNIYEDMAGSFPLNVVLDSKKEDFFENPENYKFLSELQDFLSTLEGVDKNISFLDYMKLVNFASNQFQDSFYTLPEESFEVRMLMNDFKTMLGDDMLKRFMNDDFSKTNIMLRTHISGSKDFLETKRKIEDFLRKESRGKFTYQVTGFGIVISESSKLLTEGQIKSLSITLVLVFMIMFLLFMSYKVGIIGLLPNCFPIVVTFGLMGWLRIPLSVSTSLIASIAIGLAVDDTIHYLVRYNREFKKDLDKQRALRDTILRMGRPIVMTTVAISLGFSILMISNFKPTALFGVLMVITMFSALVADLILLPSLMLHVELVTVWDLLKLKLGKDPQEGIPLFDGLSRSQVHYILMSGTLKKHETGDVIMVKGDISDSMYAVISGELEVVNIEEEGESESQVSSRQFIARLKAGDIVGEMGLIRSSARTATVIASKPAELIQINRRMIRRLQWLYPPTAQRFFFNLMTILCDRLENVTADLVGFSRAEALNRIHSRNSFLMRFEDEISRSQRYQNPLSLLIVEIDNMESLDQTFGAGTGEHILAETAELLAKTLRRSDNLCRFNERQLAVFLPQTKIKKARLACERLRVLLEKNVFQVNSNPVSVTACFGIGSMDPKHGKEMNDLLIGASGALAMAKSRGPNRIEESV